MQYTNLASTTAKTGQCLKISRPSVVPPFPVETGNAEYPTGYPKEMCFEINGNPQVDPCRRKVPKRKCGENSDGIRVCKIVPVNQTCTCGERPNVPPNCPSYCRAQGYAPGGTGFTGIEPANVYMKVEQCVYGTQFYATICTDQTCSPATCKKHLFPNWAFDSVAELISGANPPLKQPIAQRTDNCVNLLKLNAPDFTADTLLRIKNNQSVSSVANLGLTGSINIGCAGALNLGILGIRGQINGPNASGTGAGGAGAGAGAGAASGQSTP